MSFYNVHRNCGQMKEKFVKQKVKRQIENFLNGTKGLQGRFRKVQNEVSTTLI